MGFRSAKAAQPLVRLHDSNATTAPVRLACALLTVVVVASGCVGSDRTTGVPGDGLVGLVLQPAIIPSAADGSAAPINRIRAVTTRVSDNVALDVTVVDVSPTDNSWELVLTVPAPSEPTVVVVFLYLMNVANDGTQTIEFSGRSDPITLVPGEEAAPDVPIVRGPIEGLFTTGVTITSAASTMVEGTSQAFSAVATTSGSTEPPVFWTSLDVGVLTMTGASAGAVAPGIARVVASAGAFADTVLVTVNGVLVVTTTSLPNGELDIPYDETLAATGGAGGYTWAVTGGALPTGLSLSRPTGVISGTPEAASGTFTVEVTSGDAQTATRQLTIAINPTIANVDPDFGATAGGGSITITGTGFQAGATVTMGGAPATSVAFVTATTITATTPAGAPGSVDVAVTNPDGGTATAVSAFTYQSELLMVLPASAERLPGGTQQFTTTGGEGPFAWSVNGQIGGDATFGTITVDGFYQAPSTVPSPSTFQVCATDLATGAIACAPVTIQPVPTAGEDVVVFNDFNVFTNLALDFGAGDPNNKILVQNLVAFSSNGARAAGTTVWWDVGRGSRCELLTTGEKCIPEVYTSMAAVIEGAGYTIETVFSDAGTLVDIPADVKVVFLWNPTVAYTVPEINALKRFAAEGGRTVFVGEYDGFYGTWIPIENQFLKDMGAEMVNVGNGVDCNAYFDVSAASLRSHQITQEMSGARIACASVIQPGPNDFAFLFDTTNQLALAGVAKIDVTPLQPGAPPPSAALRAEGSRLDEAAVDRNVTGAGVADPTRPIRRR